MVPALEFGNTQVQVYFFSQEDIEVAVMATAIISISFFIIIC